MPAAVAVALLVPAGVVGALTSGEPGAGGSAGSDSGTRPFIPAPDVVGQPFPSDPDPVGEYPVARLNRATVVYAEPGGKAKARVDAKTEWESPRILSVVEQREGWLAVLLPELDNDEVGWIEEGAIERLDSVPFSLHADLSRRELVVKREGKPVRSVSMGVGRSTNPTPTGRFAVTDKLRVTDPDRPTAAASWRSPATRPSCPRAGPAATAWPCTPRGTSPASARRSASAACAPTPRTPAGCWRPCRSARRSSSTRSPRRRDLTREGPGYVSHET